MIASQRVQTIFPTKTPLPIFRATDDGVERKLRKPCATRARKQKQKQKQDSRMVAGYLTSVWVRRNGLVRHAKVFAQFAECTERELP